MLAFQRLTDGLDLRAFLASLEGHDEAALQKQESRTPARFRCVLELAYCAYYAHPTVRATLALHTGYPARPPQPVGYELGSTR